jgi:hypothetical protein
MTSRKSTEDDTEIYAQEIAVVFAMVTPAYMDIRTARPLHVGFGYRLCLDIRDPLLPIRESGGET